MTITSVKAILDQHAIRPDSVSRKGDIFTAKRHYFYPPEGGIQKYRERYEAVRTFEIVGASDHRGRSAATSYYRIDFRVRP